MEVVQHNSVGYSVYYERMRGPSCGGKASVSELRVNGNPAENSIWYNERKPPAILVIQY